MIVVVKCVFIGCLWREHSQEVQDWSWSTGWVCHT